MGAGAGGDEGRGVAAVTGASAGIGAAFAGRLAADGYDVLLVARREGRLRALAARLEGRYGVRAEVLVADLADGAALRGVEGRLAGEGRLALLVNNAGMGIAAGFLESEPGALERMVRLHVTAVVRLTRAALPGMVARGRGAVINVASGAVFARQGGLYGATKALVVELTESLQEGLRGTGVRLQALCPGYVRSEIYAALGREFPVPDEQIMAADVLVDAALAGLERGELVCCPSLEDGGLVGRLDALRAELLAGIEASGRPAGRYLKDTPSA